MNLSSVSNVAVNSSAPVELSSTRQPESGGSFEQMLSARKDTTPSTETASVDSNTTSNANNQQAAESTSSQPDTKEPHTDKTAAQKADADIADDSQNKVVETDDTVAVIAPNSGSSTLKNVPVADKESDIKNDADTRLTLDAPKEPVIDGSILPNKQETTIHQDESDLSSATPDEATLSLLAMLTQAQTTKTNAVSDASTTVANDAPTPAQSVAVSLTLTDETATTDAAAESDTPLTPFTMSDSGTNSRQINRADTDISKKAEFAINSDDSGDSSASADNNAITTAVVRNTESLAADSTNNTSPLIASPSHALSATAQTAAQQAAGTATTSTAMLNAQMGSEAWQQSLGQQIILFARDGQQNAKLRLHPEELGSLQINLTLNNDNEAQLHFVSAHSQVRAALEAALPHLRTSLAESGIDLGQASVGSESSQSWTQDQQTPDSGFVQQPESTTSDGLTTPLSVPASLQQMASGVTGINIFA